MKNSFNCFAVSVALNLMHTLTAKIVASALQDTDSCPITHRLQALGVLVQFLMLVGVHCLQACYPIDLFGKCKLMNPYFLFLFVIVGVFAGSSLPKLGSLSNENRVKCGAYGFGNVAMMRLHKNRILTIDEALKCYRMQNGFISRREFEEIHNFIKRVESVKSKDPISESDFEMLEKMQFYTLVDIARSFFEQTMYPNSVPLIDPSEILIWRYIHFVCSKVSKLTFKDFLAFFFCSKNINFLERKKFLDFVRLVEFVQGGSERDFLGNILILDAIFTGGITNSERILLARHCIFSHDILSIDQSKLFSIKKNRFSFFTCKMFEFYSKESTVRLKKLEIKRLPDQKNEFFFKMLQHHSSTLESLTISKPRNSNGIPVPIRFSNLVEFSFPGASVNFLRNFEFSLHPRYTSLIFSTGVSFFKESNGQEYFKIVNSFLQLDSLLLFVASNKNLKHLKIKNHLLNREQFREQLKSIVSSLKQLEICEFSQSSPNEMKGFFHSENSITSLGIFSDNPPFDWSLLKRDLSKLKKFTLESPRIIQFDLFLHFLRQNNLETLSLPEFIPEKSQMEQFFKEINELKSLKNLHLQTKIFERFEQVSLDKRFQALHFQTLVPIFTIFHSLPSGPGVKYLSMKWTAEISLKLSESDIETLKSKFPSLEVLFFVESTLSHSGNCEFEMHSVQRLEEIDILSSVPHLFISRF